MLARALGLTRSLGESSNLLLCYYALIYFFKNDPDNYVCLTELALTTCTAIADVNSIIPSELDYGLVYLINSMIYERISPDTMQSTHSSTRDARFLFLETLYNCLHALIIRCRSPPPLSLLDLNASYPLLTEVLQYLLLPIQLYQRAMGIGPMRMSMARSSYNNARAPPACTEIMILCVNSLELYCNAGRDSHVR